MKGIYGPSSNKTACFNFISHCIMLEQMSLLSLTGALDLYQKGRKYTLGVVLIYSLHINAKAVPVSAVKVCSYWK